MRRGAGGRKSGRGGLAGEADGEAADGAEEGEVESFLVVTLAGELQLGGEEAVLGDETLEVGAQAGFVGLFGLKEGLVGGF